LIQGIIGYKEKYDTGSKTGNKAVMDNAASAAQKLYDRLREVNPEAADTLTKSNYEQAKQIYGTTDKSGGAQTNQNGSGLIALRATAEADGYKVGYDSKSGTAWLEDKAGKVVGAFINGKDGVTIKEERDPVTAATTWTMYVPKSKYDDWKANLPKAPDTTSSTNTPSTQNSTPEPSQQPASSDTPKNTSESFAEVYPLIFGKYGRNSNGDSVYSAEVLAVQKELRISEIKGADGNPISLDGHFGPNSVYAYLTYVFGAWDIGRTPAYGPLKGVKLTTNFGETISSLFKAAEAAGKGNTSAQPAQPTQPATPPQPESEIPEDADSYSVKVTYTDPTTGKEGSRDINVMRGYSEDVYESTIRYVCQIPTNAGYEPRYWGIYENETGGCAASSFSMAFSAMGRNVMPKDLCDMNVVMALKNSYPDIVDRLINNYPDSLEELENAYPIGFDPVYMRWGGLSYIGINDVKVYSTDKSVPTGDALVKYWEQFDNAMLNYQANSQMYSPPIIRVKGDREHYVLVFGKNENGDYYGVDPANTTKTIFTAEEVAYQPRYMQIIPK
jgi:hypothetical protein